MPALQVPKTLRLCAAAGALAAAACSGSGDGPLASQQEIPTVPPVAEVTIRNVFPSVPQPNCNVFGYHTEFHQGARMTDRFYAVTYLPSPDHVTTVLHPEFFDDEGIDLTQPLMMRMRLSALGGGLNQGPPSPECVANLGRRWEFQGTFQALGDDRFTADFASFTEIAR